MKFNQLVNKAGTTINPFVSCSLSENDSRVISSVSVTVYTLFQLYLYKKGYVNMITIDTEKLKTIINHYGHTNQFNKAVEELSELIRALVRDDKDNLIEEMADVYIMLEQLLIMCDIPEIVIDYSINKKIERQLERMENDDQKLNHKCVIKRKFI